MSVIVCPAATENNDVISKRALPDIAYPAAHTHSAVIMQTRWSLWRSGGITVDLGYYGGLSLYVRLCGKQPPARLFPLPPLCPAHERQMDYPVHTHLPPHTTTDWWLLCLLKATQFHSTFVSLVFSFSIYMQKNERVILFFFFFSEFALVNSFFWAQSKRREHQAS